VVPRAARGRQLTGSVKLTDGVVNQPLTRDNVVGGEDQNGE
jgi:hypothetical protein